MLRIYDVEKRSTVLANVAGLARQDVYIYGPVTKWWHWGMFIHWDSNFAYRERCTSRNATRAEFLEVQIPPRILMYDWDP